MSLSPYYADDKVQLYLGDCLEALAGMADASVDAIVTDPPAGISFMGKEWDSNLGARDRWIAWLAERMAEALRVLKPGGHAVVWSLPRTAGWTQIALEDAGFEIRDCIPHLFGSGFPKSLDVSKAIDKAAGAEREVIGPYPFAARKPSGTWTGDSYAQDPYKGLPGGSPVTAPATAEAARWEGWGTALKPGQEMWWLARKPIRGTVAANVLEHGTGALNIAGCRVATGPADDIWAKNPHTHGGFGHGNADVYGAGKGSDYRPEDGRWPPNLLLTHSAACELTGTRQVRGDSRSGQEPGERQGGFADIGADRGSNRPNGALHGDQAVEVWDCAPDCPVRELDRQSGALANCGGPKRTTHSDGMFGIGQPGLVYADHGGASRFYPVFRYQAKAPASERPRGEDGEAHPTVKPLTLLTFFCRLVTPPGGTVLDMFAGSGTTAEACIVEGFRCVLIENDPRSVELIRTRLRKDIQPAMFGEAL